MDTLSKERMLKELKDPEFRRLFYAEHIHNALPFQIRELRKKRKLTQKELAALIGKHQKNLSDWESPNYEYTPQIGTLISLANAFDVPLIVRFGSWEELWDWEHSISPEKLAPRKFDEALPDLEKKLSEKMKLDEAAEDRDAQATTSEPVARPTFRLADAPRRPMPTQPKLGFMYSKPEAVAEQAGGVASSFDHFARGRERAATAGQRGRSTWLPRAAGE